jgi:hypothetical protein
VIFELFHGLALVPLVWLVGLHLAGRRRGVEWWWMAAGFGVSFLADLLAHWDRTGAVMAAYPISQAAIFLLVFVDRHTARLLILWLVGLSLLVPFLVPPKGMDAINSALSWGAVALVAWRRWSLPTPLRLSLLVYFGLGLTWLGYLAWPWWGGGWGWYLVYQATRVAGTALWCWAAATPYPRLKLRA